VRRSSSTIVADLGDALDELRTTVRREFPDEAQAVERVLARCQAVGSMVDPAAADVHALVSEVSGLLVDRSGCLGEVIIARDDYEERYRVNEAFDALRLRVRRLAAELGLSGPTAV